MDSWKIDELSACLVLGGDRSVARRHCAVCLLAEIGQQLVFHRVSRLVGLRSYRKVQTGPRIIHTGFD